MEDSACSHQLRLLRNLGLVTGERQGRSIVYSLYDNHVAESLDQDLYHVEHLRLGLHDTPAREPAPATTAAEPKSRPSATQQCSPSSSSSGSGASGVG